MLLNIKPNWDKIADLSWWSFWVPKEFREGPSIGNISKMFLEKFMREILVIFGPIGPKLCYFQHFLGILNVTFVYLLFPIMLQHLKKIVWVGHYFLEQIYTTNGLNFCIPVTFSHFLQRNISRVNIQDILSKLLIFCFLMVKLK